MASELLLINPRRRPRRVTRARRNPRRKMTALQAKYFAPGRAAPARRRRRAAVRVTKARSNPVRRRRTSRKRNVMRVRRNPRSLSIKSLNLKGALVPAAIGAGGAVALNYAYTNYIQTMLPVSMQTGILNSVAQIGLSIGLGVVAGMAFGKTVGQQVAVGAVTVTMYGLINSYMNGTMGTNVGSYTNGSGMYAPGGALSGMGAGPRMRRRRMARYVGNNAGQMAGAPPAFLNGMGRYVGNNAGQMAGMGRRGRMNGSPPPFLNGMGAGQRMRRRGRMGGGMGYVGPARIVGRGGF